EDHRTGNEEGQGHGGWAHAGGLRGREGACYFATPTTSFSRTFSRHHERIRMFETLSKGFRAARNRLAGMAELTEENLDQALRDVRLSLLEADVEFNVTKQFLARVKEQAVGQVIQTTVTDAK